MAKSRGELHVDFLRGVFSSGGQIEKANFSLQRGILKHIDPTFYLTLVQHGVRSLQELPWSPDLERFLLFDRPQRMESRDEEAARFAAILLNNIETAEDDTGDAWVPKLVLLEILRGRAEYRRYNLGTKLAQVPVDSSRFNVSSAHTPVADFLKQSIDGLHNTASVALRYSNEEVVALVTEALSIVIDETFGIPAQEALFRSR